MEITHFTALTAFFIGILHSIEPGHGKTALFAYLASGQKTWAEGVVISASSAITHSISVLIITFLSNYIFYLSAMNSRVDLIGETLSIISGSLIITLGLWIMFKGRKGAKSSSCCGNNQPDNRKKLLASGVLGIATGIIPCPTVMVACLSAISTGNLFQGLHSLFMFALGMSVSLMILVTTFSFGSSKFISRFKPKGKLLNWNYFQGLIFIVIGVLTIMYY